MSNPPARIRYEHRLFPSTDLRLRAYPHVLLRHWKVIAAVAGVVLALGVVPELLEDARYSSVASLRVRAVGTESPFEDESQPNAQNRSRELLTHVEVIESERMSDLVIEHLGAESEPFDSVSASVVGFSEVIEIKATASSPGGAADAANAYAEVFVEERQRESVEAIVTQSAELRRRVESATEQLAEIDRQLNSAGLDPIVAENLRVNRVALATQILDFRNRADELDIEAALRRGNTEIVTRARPNADPISPNPLRTGVTALVLGLLAGVAVAVILEVSQDKLTDGDELSLLDPSVTLLGTIPHFAPDAVRGRELPAAVNEAFKYIRTSLRFRGGKDPVRSLIVTSAMSSEGKTTTAAHLASAVAETGARVMLVDADLRKPAVHTRLGLPSDLGLTNVLSGEVRLQDAVQYVTPTLAVLPAGSPSAAANEILGSAGFSELLDAAADQCDLLVVDVPPVLPVADPLVVARSVDGAIVVARIGHVRRRELRGLLKRLEDARVPIVGFVANDGDQDPPYGEYAAHLAT